MVNPWFGLFFWRTVASYTFFFWLYKSFFKLPYSLLWEFSRSVFLFKARETSVVGVSVASGLLFCLPPSRSRLGCWKMSSFGVAERNQQTRNSAVVFSLSFLLKDLLPFLDRWIGYLAFLICFIFVKDPSSVFVGSWGSSFSRWGFFFFSQLKKKKEIYLRIFCVVFILRIQRNFCFKETLKDLRFFFLFNVLRCFEREKAVSCLFSTSKPQGFERSWRFLKL